MQHSMQENNGLICLGEHRASIFLKAADLIAGKYRAKLNAATMLGQSKSVHQTEIDSVCQSVDFLRFNVHFMSEIYLKRTTRISRWCLE